MSEPDLGAGPPVDAEVEVTEKLRVREKSMSGGSIFHLIVGFITMGIAAIFAGSVIEGKASFDGMFEIHGLSLAVILAIPSGFYFLYWHQAVVSMRRPEDDLSGWVDLLSSGALFAMGLYIAMCVIVWWVVDYFPQLFQIMAGVSIGGWHLPFAPFNQTSAVTAVCIILGGYRDLRHFHWHGRSFAKRDDVARRYVQRLQAPPGCATILVRQSDIQHGYALYPRRQDQSVDRENEIKAL